MKQILVDAHSLPTAEGHGANRRSAQIAELIAKADLQACALPKNIPSSRLEKIAIAARSVLHPHSLRLMLHRDLQVGYVPQNIALFGYRQQMYRQGLAQHCGEKLFLWETTKNLVAPYVAQDFGFKVIALPHELESFSFGAKQFPQRFTAEIAALAKAKAVFCISREEQWLLKLQKIEADFLPYYPAQPILEKLLILRSTRSAAIEQERFLIVGTAFNTPTRAGMIEQIDWLHQIRQSVDFQVDIVGYGTEQLASYCSHPDFKVHGEVSSEHLNRLLIHTKAALVHQTAAVGALTRIPELLLAGVPVIANNIACRSAFEHDGVYCYDDQAELAELMSKPLAMPKVLPRPMLAEQRFIQVLQKETSV